MIENKHILHVYAEPAVYTIDLIEKFDNKYKIDYVFLRNKSKYNYGQENHSKLSLYGFINILVTKKLVIINGYLNWVFLSLFILNILKVISIKLGIESDTPFKKSSFIKEHVKKYIFSKKFVFGLAGGYKNHKDYFSNNGMLKKNIFVLPMVINSEKFKPSIIKIEDEVHFYYLGKFYKRKNIEFLIKSFLQASSKNHKIKLSLIGDGEDYLRLKEIYNVHNSIKFLGLIPNHLVYDKIKNFHYIILPSLSEPWGLVINEALSCGKLAIVSDRVGCKDDFVKHIPDWMVFNPKNLESLSTCILMASKNKNYVEMATEAFTFIRDEWNYDKYKKNMFNFISHATSDDN